jgi:hypothetical protein
MAGSPTTALLISGFRSLILKVGTPTDWNNTTPRSDLIGIKVWCSTTLGFTPNDSTNLVYNGPVTASIIIPNLDIFKTYYVRYAYISNIDLTTYTYSREYSGTVYDENTSIYGFLTNDPINVPSEVLGVNPDFTNATGVFKMYSFSEDITGKGPTYGIKSGSQTGGIVVTINSATGIYAVTGLTSDTGSVTFTASYTNSWATLTVERTLMVSKSTQGYSAAFFSIDNSAVTFKRAVDTTITPTNIILTTTAQNIVGPTYKWYKQTNSTGTFDLISGATASSYTVANTDYNSTTVTNTYKCEVTGKINNTVNQTLVDQITIPLLIDSSSAISITNSNENITFAGPVFGYTGIDFTGGSAVIRVYIGTEQLNYATTGAKTFDCTIVTDGVTVTGSGSGNVFNVTQPSAMSKDTATAVVTVNIRDAAGTLSTLTSTISYSLARTGFYAAIFAIQNSAVTFKRAVDTTITPTNITLTTAVQNTDIGSPETYKWYKRNSTGTFDLISGATASSYTVVNTEYSSTVVTNTYKCELTCKINNITTVLSDQITIPLLIDSSSAISITNSNENITFAAPVFGYTGINFTSGSAVIRVYIGTEQLNYATTGAKTFDCTIVTDGVTVTGSGSGNVFNVTQPSAMSKDTATAVVTVNIRDAAGTLSTLTSTISYSLARTGFYAGIFSIQNSAVTFKRAVDTTITPTNVTLTTIAQNTDAGSESYKWYKQTSSTGTFDLISGATASSYTVANTDYSSTVVTNTYKCELTCKFNNITTTVADQITIPLLIDASSAISITNSNENITFAGAASGYAGIDFSGSLALIRAYIGTEQLNYATSGAKTFSAMVFSTSGITVTGSGSGNVFTVNDPVAMTSDTANAIIEVSIRDAANVLTKLTTTISYSLSRRGYQGVSARTAYTKTTLTSLGSTPTTIVTTGNISFPANDSWGAGTVWQATPPSITAGESVYQSDGFYNVVTDNTTWNVPYLSTLKVGTLSAITANTGDLTVTGDFKAGTAAISGTTMTGAGGLINKDGHFAFGNSTTNITYNGGALNFNGNVIAGGNIKVGTITADKLDLGAAFPTGGIITFSGSTIPPGWALCDGGNGTPDLRDRFVMGSSSTFTPGSRGGTADAVVVAHTHTITNTGGVLKQTATGTVTGSINVAPEEATDIVTIPAGGSLGLVEIDFDYWVTYGSAGIDAEFEVANVKRQILASGINRHQVHVYHPANGGPHIITARLWQST